MITMQFESKLRRPRKDVWEWITSVKGIASEIHPFFHMTSPRGVKSISDLRVTPGSRLFRSYIFLFGVLPIDFSDLTLLDYEESVGFVEESPMGSMRAWRHVRHIRDCESDPSAVVLIDRLTFEPRWAHAPVGWFIRKVFEHRHRVLRRQLLPQP